MISDAENIHLSIIQKTLELEVFFLGKIQEYIVKETPNKEENVVK